MRRRVASLGKWIMLASGGMLTSWGCAGGGLYVPVESDPFVASFPRDSLVVEQLNSQTFETTYLALNRAGAERPINLPTIDPFIAQIVHTGGKYYICFWSQETGQVTVSVNSTASIVGSKPIVTDAVTVGVPGEPTQSIFTVTPDRRLIYIDGTNAIASVPLTGGPKQTILNGSLFCLSITPSPDGSRSFVSTLSGCFILKNGTVEQSLPGAYSYGPVAWSPDSNTLYFDGSGLSSSGNEAIFSLKPGGTPSLMFLTGIPTFIYDLALSPDGHTLAANDARNVYLADLGHPSQGFKTLLAGSSSATNIVQFWTPKSFGGNSFFFSILF